MPAIKVSFVLAETPGGNLVGHADVPAQGLLGFPLINITRDDQMLTATLPVPVPGKLEAEIDATERSLRGHFSQGPFDLEIDFPRDDAYTGPNLNRPQHPDPSGNVAPEAKPAISTVDCPGQLSVPTGAV